MMASVPAVILNCPACDEVLEIGAGIEEMKISHEGRLIAVIRVDGEPFRSHVAEKHPDAA
jgi:hypothetical protein